MVSLDVLLAANRAYLLAWNAGPVAAGDDLLTYRSDVPHATLIGVLRVRGLQPRDALAAARERLDGVPRVWWAGPDSDPGTAQRLVALGATAFVTLPIMAMEIAQAATAPVPEGLLIGEATDLEEYVAAYGRVSGISAEGIAAAVVRERAFAGDGRVVRLAGRLDDGRIAGTAVCWVSHGLLTVFFVGTQPELRRRGIGAAMTLAALDLARAQGLSTVALTSSPMAEPLYRRLGFRTVGTYELLTF